MKVGSKDVVNLFVGAGMWLLPHHQTAARSCFALLVSLKQLNSYVAVCGKRGHTHYCGETEASGTAGNCIIDVKHPTVIYCSILTYSKYNFCFCFPIYFINRHFCTKTNMVPVGVVVQVKQNLFMRSK